MKEESRWREPEGRYEVRQNGIICAGQIRVWPDRYYTVKVPTLCGSDMVEVESAPKSGCWLAEFVRENQLIGSLMHWERRACQECLRALKSRTMLFERERLAYSDPKRGAMLGIETTEVQLADEQADRIRQQIQGDSDRPGFRKVSR